jgi:hypothetical protein
MNERVVMDQGNPRFSIGHQLKIGYFLIFKPLKLDVYNVTIFDYSCTKEFFKCNEHKLTLVMIDED